MQRLNDVMIDDDDSKQQAMLLNDEMNADEPKQLKRNAEIQTTTK